jgi:hypothetical protein
VTARFRPSRSGRGSANQSQNAPGILKVMYLLSRSFKHHQALERIGRLSRQKRGMQITVSVHRAAASRQDRRLLRCAEPSDPVRFDVTTYTCPFSLAARRFGMDSGPSLGREPSRLPRVCVDSTRWCDPMLKLCQSSTACSVVEATLTIPGFFVMLV